MEISIKDILRTGHVTRWQIVRTARHQTLAEHLYLVTMLSLEIANVVMRGEVTDSDKIRLMNWSLNHDVPEVITGDIATPMKKTIRSMCPEDPFDVLERQLSETYSVVKDAVIDTHLEAIVKLADITDGIVFLHTEGMGSHADYVRAKLVITLSENVQQSATKWPNYDWDAVLDMLNDLMDTGNSQIEFEKLNG